MYKGNSASIFLSEKCCISLLSKKMVKLLILVTLSTFSYNF